MELYYYLLALFVIIAFYTDVKNSKIPNWLTMSGVLAGLLYHLIFNGFDGLLFSILGLVVSGGILLLMYVFKALGAGDVKLFAAIGAIAGLHFSLYAIMYSIVFAGFIGVFILLFRKDLIKRMAYSCYRFVGSLLRRDLKSLEEFKKMESVRFPFMYAVLPGVMMTFYYFL
ncbi:A24 family peptidase [Halalkalibacter alkaliphilus]|uniref:Prepilin peptidase n=1 Tax=Halalkalibacter alkaliphilus TaxID=2917993 RepID=A0A9X2CTL0_9BACI|nr:prepilin peptidase [Halalkalibacter alkaliphilus]MCL7748017.1 prepilin peptidase [Halalkalibacter alkaliphilus]